MAGRRRVETYDRRDGDFGWRRISVNGNITATGGEGYTTKAGAEKAARRENPGIPVVDKTKKRR